VEMGDSQVVVKAKVPDRKRHPAASEHLDV
jgi:hypothetical protein